MNNQPLFSIIIPLSGKSKYLAETQEKLSQQTFKNFELLIITDTLSKTANPAIKRNIGAQKARGKYLCFLDDDSYPHADWLSSIQKQTLLHPDYAAFCGPALTPSTDNLFQQVSGQVWSSLLGSGGAGQYRSQISTSRFVDDYPTVNFIVKKSIFNKIGGFKINYWPGEDTIFCLDLINTNQKIFYHPSIIVYHHRRAIFKEHLAQTNRYALHRGHFARIFPRNSLKVGYIIPSLFLIYLTLLPIHRFSPPLYLYLFLLLLTLISVTLKSRNVSLGLLTTITIFITHVTYGFLFIKGYFSRDLKFKPRD